MLTRACAAQAARPLADLLPIAPTKRLLRHLFKPLKAFKKRL